MGSISRHISYKEATRSATAVNRGLLNKPCTARLAAMKLLAKMVFEPLREFIREPVTISSFYRSDAVNKAIGGSTTSQHVKGEAMDIKAREKAGYTNADLFEYIRLNLVFDQLIWEHGNDRNPAWVHVSYSAIGNRMEVLRAYKSGGKTLYKRL